jgi:hypothetical protein
VPNDKTPDDDSEPNAPTRFPDELLAEWIENCELPATGERYVDLDFVDEGGERVSLRGDEHIEQMYATVHLRNLRGQDSCQFFSGFSGTGKSTELRRLKSRLEQDGHVVLLADAQDYHNLSHALTLEDLTILVAGAFGEATGKELGQAVIDESYWQRLLEFLQREVDLGSAKVPAGSLDLMIGVKHERPFWLKIRDALSLAPSKLKEHSHSFIAKCVGHLRERQRSGGGVVFILDNLEKLYAPRSEFYKVTTSLGQVLSDFPDHFKLPGCHTIYTIPPFVQLTTPKLGDRYQGSRMLPAVKVVERPRDDAFQPLRRYRPGIEQLVELVGRRVPLDKVFGSRQDLLEDLIVDSGGHVRTLLRLMGELLTQSWRRGLPPDKEALRRVVTPLRQQLENIIPRSSVGTLQLMLRQQGSLKGLEPSDHEALPALMQNYAILSYSNGEPWFEIHPLVRDTVRALIEESREGDG